MSRSPRTRAALIATALTVPIVIVLALLFSLGKDDSSSSSKPLPAVTVSAPPSSAATVAPCTQLLEKLPVGLGDLSPREVHSQPDSPFVVAWGNPAIILRCGVGRPKDLVHNSSAQFFLIAPAGKTGPFYDVTSSGGDEIYTTVDRAVYIEITVPAKYAGATYVTPLSAAIDAALPAVCVGTQPDSPPLPPASKLCTNRP